jgi:hypothetical protein
VPAIFYSGKIYWGPNTKNLVGGESDNMKISDICNFAPNIQHLLRYWEKEYAVLPGIGY